MLAGKNLSLKYGNKIVFEKLDISINAGESIGLVGKSGCGKSSLLYLLSGLKKPTTGKVVFNNQDIWKMNSQKASLRRQHFGFIFQQHFLINYLTVRENVLVTAIKGTNEEKKAMEIIELLELGGLEESFPYELSGGQRQRVAVARAFMNNPSIIFADEPTESLDDENSKAVINLLQQYQQEQGLALILVTHDRKQVNDFDYILDFEKLG